MKTLLILAALVLSHIFSDHAVMQRETTAPVWGWGEPGNTVAVKTSWNGRTFKTKVAQDGSWKVWVTTAEAGGSYSITVKSGKEKLTVNDITFGEVWICSGQSNMEMPVSGFGFQGIEGSTEAILEAAETASQIYGHIPPETWFQGHQPLDTSLQRGSQRPSASPLASL